ncbi:MAG: hypothetical protein HYZ25_04720 [Chloroflexi bacterium]|nr:hypothetical protein [Chloroflexota bacterium]
MTNFFTQRYSKQGLWSLFLMCAFPLHFWTLILVFRDIQWMTERTNFWDALGVASYAMVFAFLESLLLFLILTLLGFLVPTRWTRETRIALLSALFLILSIWAMLGQLYFLAAVQTPGWFIFLMARTGHPVRILYALALILVTPTLALPAWFALRSEKFLNSVNSLIERLSLLSGLYLFFDVIGLIIIVIRNLA